MLKSRYNLLTRWYANLYQIAPLNIVCLLELDQLSSDLIMREWSEKPDSLLGVELLLASHCGENISTREKKYPLWDGKLGNFSAEVTSGVGLSEIIEKLLNQRFAVPKIYLYQDSELVDDGRVGERRKLSFIMVCPHTHSNALSVLADSISYLRSFFHNYLDEVPPILPTESNGRNYSGSGISGRKRFFGGFKHFVKRKICLFRDSRGAGLRINSNKDLDQNNYSTHVQFETIQSDLMEKVKKRCDSLSLDLSDIVVSSFIKSMLSSGAVLTSNKGNDLVNLISYSNPLGSSGRLNSIMLPILLEDTEELVTLSRSIRNDINQLKNWRFEEFEWTLLPIFMPRSAGTILKFAQSSTHGRLNSVIFNYIKVCSGVDSERCVEKISKIYCCSSLSVVSLLTISIVEFSDCLFVSICYSPLCFDERSVKKILSLFLENVKKIADG